MKRTIILILGLLFALISFAQDQTINGNLTTEGEISVGKDNGIRGEGARLYLKGTHVSNDYVWLAKYTGRQEITDLRINIGDNVDETDRLVVGITKWDTKSFHEMFVVRSDGNVGIGVAQPTSKLDVNGTIRAKEVKIEATGWADFVFSPDYQLKPLWEVENHIKEHNHLPDIPSETEVKENGISVGEMQTKLLQKIEELTLYVIEQDKKIESQNSKIAEQQKEIANLKNK